MKTKPKPRKYPFRTLAMDQNQDGTWFGMVTEWREDGTRVLLRQGTRKTKREILLMGRKNKAVPEAEAFRNL